MDLTVVFDLDGTLVDTAPDLIGAMQRLLASRELAAVPEAELRPLISLGSRAMLKRALAINAYEIDSATFEAWWQDYLGIYEANIAVASRPFDGLTDVLDSLEADGTRLAVCTNKTEALSLKLLDELGLRRRFQAICGRDTFPVCKPDPLHLVETIRAAGGAPGRALMVGDSDVDIATARAAGVPVVAVTFGYCIEPVASHGPDVTIDHYRNFRSAMTLVL